MYVKNDFETQWREAFNIYVKYYEDMLLKKNIEKKVGKTCRANYKFKGQLSP